MNQGGSSGASLSDVLKLLYGTAMGSAAATTDGIGLTLSDATRNTEVT
jgi:hypothetical protein